MQALDLFLNQSEPVVSSYVPAEISTKGNLSGANLVENIFNIIGKYIFDRRLYGAGESGDTAGLKCRDLTSEESRQCHRWAGALIYR